MIPVQWKYFFWNIQTTVLYLGNVLYPISGPMHHAALTKHRYEWKNCYCSDSASKLRDVDEYVRAESSDSGKLACWFIHKTATLHWAGALLSPFSPLFFQRVALKSWLCGLRQSTSFRDLCKKIKIKKSKNPFFDYFCLPLCGEGCKMDWSRESRESVSQTEINAWVQHKQQEEEEEEKKKANVFLCF